MPGTPTASKITSGREPSTRRQATTAGSSRGSTTSVAPMVVARRRRAWEKSAATIVSTPASSSAAMTASPTGPQPSTTAAWRGSTLLISTACRPTAIGSVRAASSGSRPLGTVMVNMSDRTSRSPYPPG